MKERIKKAGSSDKTGVENRKKKICGELEEKNLAMRKASRNGNGICGGDMGMEGEKRSGGNARKVDKMDDGNRLVHAGVHDERRDREGQVYN